MSPVLGGGAALAQGFADPYSDFSASDDSALQPSPGFEVAPGYDRPDMEADVQMRDEITLFNEPPSSSEPADLDRPLNVFAGEKQRFDNGVFGVIFDGVRTGG
ncbi:MAG: hypothetical protein AAF909_10300 [Pseudomonadota bacterium]